MNTVPSSHPGDPRRDVYYWKCDRPDAFRGVLNRAGDELDDQEMAPRLADLLGPAFPGMTPPVPLPRKGNHRTFTFSHRDHNCFVRVEDGPEHDAHLDAESVVITKAGQAGVPVPEVYFTDATRQQAPFAVQVIEAFDYPDLGQLHRQGRLDLPTTAAQIGGHIARWQKVPVDGFGPFDPIPARQQDRLRGYHSTYHDYFSLRLDAHLVFLVKHEFLSQAETDAIRELLDQHRDLLQLEQGCLVHKDLALWNILGDANRIAAFIDWDDAVAGDPCDDLSLPACFHDAETVQAVVDGYRQVKPLPTDFLPRFWLHLLRNMIVKSVIRCGAGYFTSGAGSFLVPPGQTVDAFRAFTRERLLQAVEGLRATRPLEHL